MGAISFRRETIERQLRLRLGARRKGRHRYSSTCSAKAPLYLRPTRRAIFRRGDAHGIEAIGVLRPRPRLTPRHFGQALGAASGVSKSLTVARALHELTTRQDSDLARLVKRSELLQFTIDAEEANRLELSLAVVPNQAPSRTNR